MSRTEPKITTKPLAGAIDRTVGNGSACALDDIDALHCQQEMFVGPFGGVGETSDRARLAVPHNAGPAAPDGPEAQVQPGDFEVEHSAFDNSRAELGYADANGKTSETDDVTEAKSLTLVGGGGSNDSVRTAAQPGPATDVVSPKRQSVILTASLTDPLLITCGAVFGAPYDTLSVAPDNFWSGDVNAKDEAYRRILATARHPADLDALLVTKAGNGWAIVGDPAAYLAVGVVHKDDPGLGTIDLPVVELHGTKAAVVLHTARAGLGGRTVKNIRRARLALLMMETDGLGNGDVASLLHIHGSGATRALRAARMEREHPALAKILITPSDAPVSYYTDIREHAERQPAPEKALGLIAAAAGRLAKAGKTFSPADAKAALCVIKPKPKRGGTPVSIVKERLAFPTAGPAYTAVLEQAGHDLRLTLTFPATGDAFEQRVAQLEHWLAATPPVGSSM